MFICKLNKFVYIRADCFYSTLHGRYSVSLSLQTYTLSPDGTSFVHCQKGGTTAMMPGQIAAENEYFIGLQSFDVIGGNSLFHLSYFLHSHTFPIEVEHFENGIFICCPVDTDIADFL